MSNVLTTAIFGKQLDAQMSLADAFELLDSQNLINIGELAELAISAISGVELCSKNTPDIDLITGKQIKHVRVCKSPSSDYYKAYISINTCSDILCVITNPVANDQYYLYIPYRAFKHYSANTISISFGRCGLDPRPSHWWHYEVSSFQELCELAK